MGHGKVTVGHIGKPGHGCEYGAVAQWCDLVFVELHPGSNIVERLWRVRKIHAVTLVDIGIVDADKIICLKKGKLVEMGTHKDLINMNGYYYNLYNNMLRDNKG